MKERKHKIEKAKSKQYMVGLIEGGPAGSSPLTKRNIGKVRVWVEAEALGLGENLTCERSKGETRLFYEMINCHLKVEESILNCIYRGG